MKSIRRHEISVKQYNKITLVLMVYSSCLRIFDCKKDCMMHRNICLYVCQNQHLYLYHSSLVSMRNQISHWKWEIWTWYMIYGSHIVKKNIITQGNMKCLTSIIILKVWRTYAHILFKKNKWLNDRLCTDEKMFYTINYF